MDNWKRVSTESGQTNQQKPEMGSTGNWILENWREDRNRPSLSHSLQVPPL